MQAAQQLQSKTKPRPKRMTLSAVKTGRLTRPTRVLLYGPEGIGKSTFASKAPSPIYLGTEEGTSQLDVSRMPEPECWQDVQDAIEVLTNEKHEYQTLVIDTLDWLEPVCWQHVCKQGGETSIEGFGYGKGYAAALDQWRSLLAAVDRLRSTKQMHVIALAHSWIRPFQNPAGDNYDRYELKLHNRASGLWKEWSDTVLFAVYEDYAHKADKNAKAKGVTTGARIMRTSRHPAWDAKTRYMLPETLPLDWEEFWAAVQQGSDPQKLLAQIAELVVQVDEKTAKAVKASLDKVSTDTRQLARIANKLTAIINEVTQ